MTYWLAPGSVTEGGAYTVYDSSPICELPSNWREIFSNIFSTEPAPQATKEEEKKGEEGGEGGGEEEEEKKRRREESIEETPTIPCVLDTSQS